MLSLNKLGYANSASPSGTALTYQQLESVSKYTSKILICFDNDEAGLKATERVLEIKNQISKQVEIHCLNLPCLLYTSPSPRDRQKSRMPSSA